MTNIFIKIHFVQDAILLSTINNYLILQPNVQPKEGNMKIRTRDLRTIFSKLVAQKVLQIMSQPVIEIYLTDGQLVIKQTNIIRCAPPI